MDISWRYDILKNIFSMIFGYMIQTSESHLWGVSENGIHSSFFWTWETHDSSWFHDDKPLGPDAGLRYYMHMCYKFIGPWIPWTILKLTIVDAHNWIFTYVFYFFLWGNMGNITIVNGFVKQLVFTRSFSTGESQLFGTGMVLAIWSTRIPNVISPT